MLPISVKESHWCGVLAHASRVGGLPETLGSVRGVPGVGPHSRAGVRATTWSCCWGRGRSVKQTWGAPREGSGLRLACHIREGVMKLTSLSCEKRDYPFQCLPFRPVTGYPPSPSKRKTHGPPAPRGLTPPADRHGLHPAPVCPTPEKGFQGSRDRPGSSQRVLNPNEK